MNGPPSKQGSHKYYKYYNDFGHTTDQCRSLKAEIAYLLKRGVIRKDVIDGKPKPMNSDDKKAAPPTNGVVLVLAGESAEGSGIKRKRKAYASTAMSGLEKQLIKNVIEYKIFISRLHMANLLGASQADALSKYTSASEHFHGPTELVEELHEPLVGVSVDILCTSSWLTWLTLISEYIQEGELPKDDNKAIKTKRRAERPRRSFAKSMREAAGVTLDLSHWSDESPNKVSDKLLISIILSLCATAGAIGAVQLLAVAAATSFPSEDCHFSDCTCLAIALAVFSFLLLVVVDLYVEEKIRLSNQGHVEELLVAEELWNDHKKLIFFPVRLLRPAQTTFLESS
ncbi:hypothetical protein Taro_004329 [Colocasia esculenta]|uniref:Uncharacterized protein n=1 Tax=Colocasia esculenta TaxID=4460 RepID=A0A843TRB2_COLES|nr:hypothetical protein [Colocasia esculenta]